MIGRGQIRVADAKAYDVPAIILRLLFHPVDFSEQIGREPLETLGPLDLNGRHGSPRPEVGYQPILGEKSQKHMANSPEKVAEIYHGASNAASQKHRKQREIHRCCLKWLKIFF
jgi:hypothetical protein